MELLWGAAAETHLLPSTSRSTNSHRHAATTRGLFTTVTGWVSCALKPGYLMKSWKGNTWGCSEVVLVLQTRCVFGALRTRTKLSADRGNSQVSGCSAFLACPPPICSLSFPCGKWGLRVSRRWVLTAYKYCSIPLHFSGNIQLPCTCLLH